MVKLKDGLKINKNYKPYKRAYQNNTSMNPYQGSSNLKNSNKLENAKYSNSYCIFCEIPNHDSGFCRNKEHTYKFKQEKCRKHNACYCCLRTMEHKAENCPKRRKCLICENFHHFRLSNWCLKMLFWVDFLFRKNTILMIITFKTNRGRKSSKVPSCIKEVQWSSLYAF